VEARKLEQRREEALLDLLDELALAALVDRLVASNGDVHGMPVSAGVEVSVESSGSALTKRDSRGTSRFGDVGGV
jgi:hypothetical protein